MSIVLKMSYDLIRLADAYLAVVPMRLPQLSARATGSETLLGHIRAGMTGKAPPARKIAGQTYDRAMQEFSDHWPDGAAWPADIVRPVPRPPSQQRRWARASKRLTRSERVAMLADYHRGESLDEIAARFGIDRSYPTQLAKRLGLELRGGGPNDRRSVA